VTRLGSFLKANGIKPAVLAREAGVSRSYLNRLRSGKLDPTRRMMLKVRDACSRLLDRTVYLAELFDLGDAPVAVTSAHGERFAEEWYRGQIEDACDAAGVMQWPEDGTAEEQDRHHDLTDEICMHVFHDVRATIAEAFIRIATAVLARERSR
jgi:transcriptional regulator with XRE-family HTH domain